MVIYKQMNRITIKYYIILANIKICFYIKFPMPLCNRHFFKILSQNPEYVKTHCIDRNNSFHFTIRKKMIIQ